MSIWQSFSGSGTARWHDPSNGTFTPITDSPFANSGSRCVLAAWYEQ